MLASCPVLWRVCVRTHEIEVLSGEIHTDVPTRLFGVQRPEDISFFDLHGTIDHTFILANGRWQRSRTFPNSKADQSGRVFGFTEDVTEKIWTERLLNFHRSLEHVNQRNEDPEVKINLALPIFSHAIGNLPVAIWKTASTDVIAPSILTQYIPPGKNMLELNKRQELVQSAKSSTAPIWCSAQLLGDKSAQVQISLLPLRWGQNADKVLEVTTEGSKEACSNLEPLIVSAARMLAQFKNEQRLCQRMRTTERLLAQSGAELEALFESSPVGIAQAVDASCNVIKVNPAAAHMLGISSREYYSKSSEHGHSLPFKVFYQGQELSPEQFPLQRATKGEFTNELRLDIVHQDGRINHLFEFAYPLFHESGAVRGAVGFFVDVTALHEAEHRLQDQLRHMAEANQRKNQFIALLGHELRNPLAAIASAAQLLRRPDMASKHPWALEILDRQILHFKRLLDDLLDLARITHNKLQLRKEVVDFREIIEKANDTLRPQLEGKGQRAELFLPSMPVHVNADPTRLEQIVLNLITNAVKYSDNDRLIRLRLTVENQDAVFEVQDQGIGIPKELLNSLFEPFSQELPSHERTQGGLGIGLALVKSIVELHGGTVHAHSPGKDQGSTFTVRLALAPDCHQRESIKPHHSVSAPASHQQRVLVVEDNPDTARGLTLFIEALGHQVWTAGSCAEAIAIAETKPLDVVFLDIGLPEMDGYELLKKLRELKTCRDVRVIALTGFGHATDIARSELAGIESHLVKPADYSMIERILQISKPFAGNSKSISGIALDLPLQPPKKSSRSKPITIN